MCDHYSSKTENLWALKREQSRKIIQRKRKSDWSSNWFKDASWTVAVILFYALGANCWKCVGQTPGGPTSILAPGICFFFPVRFSHRHLSKISFQEVSQIQLVGKATAASREWTMKNKNRTPTFNIFFFSNLVWTWNETKLSLLT